MLILKGYGVYKTSFSLLCVTPACNLLIPDHEKTALTCLQRSIDQLCMIRYSTIHFNPSYAESNFSYLMFCRGWNGP